jgi:hypothetical protein
MSASRKQYRLLRYKRKTGKCYASVECNTGRLSHCRGEMGIKLGKSELGGDSGTLFDNPSVLSEVFHSAFEMAFALDHSFF